MQIKVDGNLIGEIKSFTPSPHFKPKCYELEKREYVAGKTQFTMALSRTTVLPLLTVVKIKMALFRELGRTGDT